MKFEDYSADELIQMFDGILQEYGLSNETDKDLFHVLKSVYKDFSKKEVTGDTAKDKKETESCETPPQKTDLTETAEQEKQEEDKICQTEQEKATECKPQKNPTLLPVENTKETLRNTDNEFNRTFKFTKPQIKHKPPMPCPLRPMPPIPEFKKPINPSNQKAISLAEDIFQQITSLEQSYLALIKLGGRRQTGQIEKLTNELMVLQLPVLNIYYRLSGRNKPPFVRKEVYEPLPNNYCLALRVTFNRVSYLYDDILSLQSLVSYPSIDRQLIIIASSLQKQLTIFNSLLIDCLM